MKTTVQAFVIGVLWVACSVPLMAATAVWTNTVNGSSGSWTAVGNWNSATYPGQSAAGDNAFLTNAVSSVYTARVDSVTPYSIAQLAIRNGGTSGRACLMVANGVLTNTSIMTNGVGGALLIDAGGQLYFAGKASQDGGAVVVVQNGGIWSNSAPGGNIFIGDSLPGNQMVVQGGGKVYCAGDNTQAGRNVLGSQAGSVSNVATITGSGSLWQSASDLSIGYYGNYNSMVVSNGAAVVVAGTNLVGVYGTNSTMLITDSGSSLSTWDSLIGLGGQSNSVVVSNGASFNVSRLLYVGGAYSGYGTQTKEGGNTLLVTDPQSRCAVSNSIYMGRSGIGGDSIIVSNGAILNCTNFIYIGVTAPNASVQVVGTGSSLLNAGTGNELHVGNGGVSARLVISDGGTLSNAVLPIRLGNNTASAYNTLIVSNGGTLVSASGYIGYGGPSNTVWVGGYQPVTLKPSVWAAGSTLIIGNASSWNTMTIAEGGIVTNIASSGLIIGNATGLNDNTLVVTNGGAFFGGGTGFKIGTGTGSRNSIVVNKSSFTYYGSSSCFIGTGGTNNALLVVSNGIVDMGGRGFVVGSDAGSAPGFSNRVSVTGGSVLTNVCRAGVNIYVGGATNADYSSFVVSNNSHMYMNAGRLCVGSFGNVVGGNSNLFLVSESVLRTDDHSYIGTVSTGNTATLLGRTMWYSSNKVTYVGFGQASSNSLLLSEGSQLLGSSSCIVGSNAMGSGNSVLVSGGSVLEASNLVVAAGNSITCTGSVYQFTVTNPVVSGLVVLNNGVISFRNVRAADINAQVNGSLSNVSFSGNNSFRLCNATNSTVGVDSQSYTFAPNAAPAYAGLEMVEGSTSYTNGNITIGSGGWLTFSNTSAVVWGNVTNSGTITITNSSVTFRQNLKLNTASTLVMSTNKVSVLGNVDLASSANLTITGPLGLSDQAVLFETTSGTITMASADWQVSPDNHRVSVSSDGKRLMLLPARRGLMFIVE